MSVLGQESGHRWLAFLDIPRSQPAQRSDRAARPRPGALELLLRLRRVGDGRQRHRGSGRRLVPDRRARCSATACSISMRWARPGLRRAARSSTSRAPPTCRARAHERVGAAGRGDVQRHEARRPHPGHRRRQRPARAVGRRVAEGPSPGVHLPRERGQAGGPGARAKIDRIRTAWEAFFLQATDRRG